MSIKKSSMGPHPNEADSEPEIQPQLFRELKELLSEYTKSSTLHGVRYFGERGRPLAERIWWIIVVTISCYICGSLILNLSQKWNNSPGIVIVGEKLTSVWEIPFPAVTICPETKTQKEYLDVTKLYHSASYGPPYANTSEDELRLLGTISQICDAHLFENAELGNKTTDSTCIDDMRMLAPADVIMTCKWGNTVYPNCSNLFTEILTEEGICYSFNILDHKEMFRAEEIHQNYQYFNHLFGSYGWTLTDGYSSGEGKNTYPNRVLGGGARSGLFVLLKLDEKDLDYICRGPVQGFKIILHSPDEMPQISKHFFRVPLNKEVIASVRPRMVATSDNLRYYDSSQRQCFFNDERYLRYFKQYTQQNCELECLANYTIKQCGCAKFSMPLDSVTPICGAASVKCYNDAEDNLTLNDLNKNRESPSCNCLPACTSTTYEADLSQADFDSYKLFKAFEVDPNESTGWHLSRLSIFFKEQQFIKSRRTELNDQTSFIASCGGLLSFFMGASILSVIELIYFSTIRLICNFRLKTEKKRSNSEVLLNINSHNLLETESNNLLNDPTS